MSSSIEDGLKSQDRSLIVQLAANDVRLPCCPMTNTTCRAWVRLAQDRGRGVFYGGVSAFSVCAPLDECRPLARM